MKAGIDLLRTDIDELEASIEYNQQVYNQVLLETQNKVKEKISQIQNGFEINA